MRSRITPATLERILTQPWPGNIRQLENFLQQAVVLAEGDSLTERDLFAGDFSSVAGPALSGLFEAGLPLSEGERRHILPTLHKALRNRTKAAPLLQISGRCLQNKLKASGPEVAATARADLRL